MKWCLIQHRLPGLLKYTFSIVWAGIYSSVTRNWGQGGGKKVSRAVPLDAAYDSVSEFAPAVFVKVLAALCCPAVGDGQWSPEPRSISGEWGKNGWAECCFLPWRLCHSRCSCAQLSGVMEREQGLGMVPREPMSWGCCCKGQCCYSSIPIISSSNCFQCAESPAR